MNKQHPKNHILKASDPEFTAKAIDEVSWGSPEKPVAEEDQEFFGELQEFAAFLRSELSAEQSVETLHASQIEHIESRLRKPNLISFPKLYWISGMAAAILLMALVPITTDLWKGALDRSLETETISEIEFVMPPPAPAAKQTMKFRPEELRNELSSIDDLDQLNAKGALSSDSIVAGSGLGGNAKPEMMSLMRDQLALDLKVDEKTTTVISEGTLGGPAVKNKRLNQPVQTPERNLSTKQLSSLVSESKLEKTVLHPQDADLNREGYAYAELQTFKQVALNPLSTFSIDVDTASYSNVRRFLNHDQLPPAGAVRVEEMLNYFVYPSYSTTESIHPIQVDIASIPSPWEGRHPLVRIAVTSPNPKPSERPEANLVFLVDVSGSMNQPQKLPLVQYTLKQLVGQMGDKDRIAIVTYAGQSGVFLPSTTANNKETIDFAVDQLKSGGSTNGSAGIELAYNLAQQHFIKSGINRVILCTDGDFNVGLSSEDALVRLIEGKRNSGVFFSVLGFGTGNFQDAKMELLSNKGNGNFAYIDSESEARRQLVGNLSGMLTCVAKDVKIQVEFNPAAIQAYRLIGYDNRSLAKEDFNDDRKDAGEMGAGQSVTALYEIVPVGVDAPDPVAVDELRYQTPHSSSNDTNPINQEWLNVKIRYKFPDASESVKFESPYMPGKKMKPIEQADIEFAAAVAGFGMKLRGDKALSDYSWQSLQALTHASLEQYSDDSRIEFSSLIEKAATLMSPIK